VALEPDGTDPIVVKVFFAVIEYVAVDQAGVVTVIPEIEAVLVTPP